MQINALVNDLSIYYSMAVWTQHFIAIGKWEQFDLGFACTINCIMLWCGTYVNRLQRSVVLCTPLAYDIMKICKLIYTMPHAHLCMQLCNCYNLQYNIDMHHPPPPPLFSKHSIHTFFPTPLSFVRRACFFARSLSRWSPLAFPSWRC